MGDQMLVLWEPAWGGGNFFNASSRSLWEETPAFLESACSSHNGRQPPQPCPFHGGA